MTEQEGQEEVRELPKLDQLEAAVKELQPASDATVRHVDSALAHLAAATSDLQAVRDLEALARGR